MRTKIFVLMLVMALLLPVQALADHGIVVQDGELQSVTTTFECGDNGATIHPESGGLIPGSTMEFPNPD